MFPATVPVVDQTGRIVSRLSSAAATLLPSCRVVKNRRGHVVRVRASVDTPWTIDLIARGKPSRWGQSFEQSIQTGHVWALKGVRGSRRDSA